MKRLSKTVSFNWSFYAPWKYQQIFVLISDAFRGYRNISVTRNDLETKSKDGKGPNMDLGHAPALFAVGLN